jgi:hypothetical protein
MTPEEFVLTVRGQYIMAQVMWKGIKVMKAVPEPHKEVSNIHDAEYLLSGLFPSQIRAAGFFNDETQTAINAGFEKLKTRTTEEK